MNRYYANRSCSACYIAVFVLTLLALLALGKKAIGAEAETRTEAELRQEHWDLKRGNVALEGYDPVTIFTDEEPRKGSRKITATYKGVTYRFTSEANRERFLEAPDAYEPAYGGWCAYAVLDGGKTSPDPKRYKIVDGRLLLFYDAWGTDTLDLWNDKLEGGADEGELLATADDKWNGLTAAKD
jgi:YHS domain-containing protein